MTTNSQLSTSEPKNKQTNKQKISKQLEQEQKWRSHGGVAVGRGRMGEKYRE